MRHRRDMSVEEVAERAGIDPSVIEAIEVGYPQASCRRSGERGAYWTVGCCADTYIRVGESMRRGMTMNSTYRIDGIATSALSGEGLVATLRGPGPVFIQTRSPQELGFWLLPNTPQDRRR